MGYYSTNGRDCQEPKRKIGNALDKSERMWYNISVGVTGDGHFLECVKKIIALSGKVGRLSFFIINIHHKTNDRYNQRTKQKENFPRHDHVYHLPLRICYAGH